MIAKIHEAKLTDGSKVYDVLIEESGVTLASIPCPTKEDAICLLYSMKHHSNLTVIDC